MRAIVIRSKGGPDVLEFSDEPEPTPGDDELLVAVEAVGVNYRDVYEREGRGAAYGRAPVPRIIGAEGAGTVLQGAGEFAEGDRVAWAAADGSYAEQAAVPVGAGGQGARRHVLRARRRRDPAGDDRALPVALDLRGAAPATSRSCTPPPAASGCCWCR